MTRAWIVGLALGTSTVLLGVAASLAQHGHMLAFAVVAGGAATGMFIAGVFVGADEAKR